MTITELEKIRDEAAEASDALKQIMHAELLGILRKEMYKKETPNDMHRWVYNMQECCEVHPSVINALYEDIDKFSGIYDDDNEWGEYP